LWIQSATQTANIFGDQTFDKRLGEALGLWTKTYKTTGEASKESPLAVLIRSYSYLRPNLNEDARKEHDDFFRGLIDTEALDNRNFSTVGALHARHAMHALAVGFVIDDPGLQYYGLKTYQDHLRYARWTRQNTFSASDIETVENVLEAAFILERSGLALQRSEVLHIALEALFSSQQEPSMQLVQCAGLAAYFRPEFYSKLATMAVAAKIPNSRFGSGQSAILAAIRKPSSTLLPLPAAPRLNARPVSGTR
jgi:hypothetical protein